MGTKKKATVAKKSRVKVMLSSSSGEEKMEERMKLIEDLDFESIHDDEGDGNTREDFEGK